ncbi:MULTISPECIES: type II pantothenate kinase [unclassified Bacillus (in: firmicutes)]|uniref:type II pantothenate kinase n=1 Tax=unclassified Bacillus (in: firmicutes) TaxID=185979 RepID=UPI0008F3D0F7|nr:MULTISPECIES: type II pantothenate kinase [unclassified Bacillus (in: firmicutes)]SFA71864.1 pantothenate kinase [Bacillus sp. UNCCL13]SFQ62166.1 pantothenate kinase [Bacillus sp. cl95]
MKRIGIDAGGSLMKITYQEKGNLHFKKFQMNEKKQALSWLKIAAPDADIVLTGGKAGNLQKQYFNGSSVVDEFEATCNGAVHLLKKNNELPKNPFLLVNIGTGTSWHLINNEKQERVFGSGIGGGTLMGLGSILSTEKEYRNLVELATEGTRDNVDLLVRDIYAPNEPPLDGNLTASNFAKASMNLSQSPSDLVASLINMMAETIMLFTAQNATIHGTSQVYFIGSTLAGNLPFKNKLSTYGKMLGQEVHFIPGGEYSGAVGAMISI